MDRNKLCWLIVRVPFFKKKNLVKLSELTLHQRHNFLYQQFVHGGFNDNTSRCPFTDVNQSIALDGQLALKKDKEIQERKVTK